MTTRDGSAMPYAINQIDGLRVNFEDWGGMGVPVVFYTGFLDPIAVAQASGIAHGLRDEFRLIFSDHRGHGNSDKPIDPAAYGLRIRVADHLAVLDALGIDRAHVIGFSWGARLGFAIGEQAPDRVRSLVLCGNQPYEWDLSSPIARALAAGMEASRTDGMEGLIEGFESGLGIRFQEPARTLELANDPEALYAAWKSVPAEGSISDDLTRWRVPCLIYCGSDDEMHDAARRGAEEIPSATFLSLPGHTHVSAEGEVGAILGPIRELLRSH